MSEIIDRVEIEPGSLRRLVQASRTWDAASRRAMRQNLRVPADRAANEAKSRVRGLPAKTQTGLREMLASGVKVTISTGRVGKSTGEVTGEGVRIIASKSQLPADKAPMAASSMASSFRHPTFGHAPYVTQRGANWFYGPLRGNANEYRAAIVAAIEEATAAIEAL